MEKKSDTVEKASKLKYNVVCLAYFLNNPCILGNCENCEILLSKSCCGYVFFFPNEQENKNIYFAERLI